MSRPPFKLLRVECLEKREMLSVTATVVNGDTLVVTGDSQPNVIRVVEDAAAVEWSVVGDNVSLGSFSNIRNIFINPTNGPDVVSVQGTQLPGSLGVVGGPLGIALTVSGAVATPSAPVATPLAISGSLLVTGGLGPDVVQLRSVSAQAAAVILAAGNDQLWIQSAGTDGTGTPLDGLNADAVALLMGSGDDLVSITAAVKASSFIRIDGGSNSTSDPGDTINGTANIEGPAGFQLWVNFETVDSALPEAKTVSTRGVWDRIGGRARGSELLFQ